MHAVCMIGGVLPLKKELYVDSRRKTVFLVRGSDLKKRSQLSFDPSTECRFS